MVVDFEQAVLMDATRQALSHVVPNKRTLRMEGVGNNKSRGQPDSKTGLIRFPQRGIIFDRLGRSYSTRI
jgi:hypothetical protein